MTPVPPRTVSAFSIFRLLPDCGYVAPDSEFEASALSFGDSSDEAARRCCAVLAYTTDFDIEELCALDDFVRAIQAIKYDKPCGVSISVL